MIFNKNKIFITKELYYTVKFIKNRIIYVPNDELKRNQRIFLKAIKRIYYCKVNTLNCAKIHSGKKWILKLDIKDFFNSVPYNSIEEVIKKVCLRFNKNEKYPEYLSLVTVNSKLPTGAPTSSHIANACFLPIDKNIQSLCSTFGVDYTRYVDDLTFSAYNKETLKIIENEVKGILHFYGYKTNQNKTKYISDNKQQNILGLVVNNYKIRLNKDFKRKIRAMLHSYCVFYSDGNKDIKHLAWDEKRKQSLKGYLSYIKHVDCVFYNQLKEYSKKLSHKYFVVVNF